MDPKKAVLLLIEDEPINIQMYVLKFKLEGLEMIVAQTAAEGENKINELKPDLVLLDLRLDNGNDGFEILRRVKDNPATASIPVYLLSNVREKGNIERGRQLGAEGFISKVNSKPNEVVEIVKAKLESLPDKQH